MGVAFWVLAVCSVAPSATPGPIVSVQALLLDEMEAPVRATDVSLVLSKFGGATAPGRLAPSPKSTSFVARTDSEGKLEIDIPWTPSVDSVDMLRISWLADGRSYEALREFTPEGNALSLGPVRLMEAGSTAVLSKLEPSELLAEYRTATLVRARSNMYQHQIETCLTEIARRGGDWCNLLEAELLAVREIKYHNHELSYIIALRKAQRKGCPIEVRLDSKKLRADFPDIGFLHYVVKNCDPDGRPIRHTTPGFMRLEVTDPNGRSVRTEDRFVTGAVGAFFRQELKHAEEAEERAAVETPVELHLPGTYRVRALFRDERPPPNVQTTAGLLFVATNWVDVNWQPHSQPRVGR